MCHDRRGRFCRSSLGGGDGKWDGCHGLGMPGDRSGCLEPGGQHQPGAASPGRPCTAEGEPAAIGQDNDEDLHVRRRPAGAPAALPDAGDEGARLHHEDERDLRAHPGAQAGTGWASASDQEVQEDWDTQDAPGRDRRRAAQACRRVQQAHVGEQGHHGEVPHASPREAADRSRDVLMHHVRCLPVQCVRVLTVRHDRVV